MSEHRIDVEWVDGSVPGTRKPRCAFCRWGVHQRGLNSLSTRRGARGWVHNPRRKPKQEA